LIKRYREEIKHEKTMAKSEKNLNKVCESLKKSNENYLRNIDILQNKLDSKHKYLSILEKKLGKQESVSVSNFEKPDSQKRTLRQYHSNTKLDMPKPNLEEPCEEEPK
jgi:hypothetical protein